MTRVCCYLICVLLSLAWSLAWAQEGILWEELTQAEQEVLQQVPGLEAQWNELPGQRQEDLRRGAQRWQEMAAAERAAAERAQSQFESLPVEQQQEIMERFQVFNSLPEAQQVQLRDLQQQFQELPEEQRELLRERFEQEIQGNTREQLLDLRESPLDDSERPPTRPDDAVRVPAPVERVERLERPVRPTTSTPPRPPTRIQRPVTR